MDHIITLTNRQEEALAAICNRLSTKDITVLPDDWIRDMVLPPIKDYIQQQKAIQSAAIADAYDAASKATQSQVKSLLGIT